jgi:hypothetical protein
MTFSLDELQSIFDSFVNIFKSIWQSVKLLTATLKLNLKVLAGTIVGNRKMVDDAFAEYTASRQDYDREMADNLQYFKKYYMESRLDTLGGFGPKVLAFAANPFLFAGTQVSSATVRRGGSTLSGGSTSLEPYSTEQGPLEMLFGKSRGYSGGEPSPGSTPPTTGRGAAAATTAAATRIPPSDRVKRALDFFEYDASLSEAAQPIARLPDVAVEEARALNAVARNFVSSERKRGDELLSRVSNIVSSLREITNAKNFDELIKAMQDAERRGIKLSTSGIQTANKKIRDELEKQKKEDPDKFKQAVDMMRKKSSDIKEDDDVEAAMLFMFGVSKSNIQQQLIKMQDEFLTQIRSTMNLPIKNEDRELLQQSEIGKEYLKFVSDFERELTTGEKEAESLKKGFKSSKSGV